MEHFIDAHCHYTADAFGAYTGPCEFVCNATSEADWAPILAAAATDVRIHPAIGIHPWYWRHAIYGWPDRMRRLLIENPRLMVGEIGLDNIRNDIVVQRKIFRIQYAMAAELRRTVHVHCVHAWNHMLDIFKKMPCPPVIVAHRYVSSEQFLAVVRKSVDNIYFSYRDITSERMQKIVMATPSDRILVETDGNVPNPAKIVEVVSQIAKIRGRSVPDMADIIYKNTLRVINNGQIA